MSDTDTNTTTDDETEEEPNPCRRFFAIPENGGEMYTCLGCGLSKEEKGEFDALEACQR